MLLRRMPFRLPPLRRPARLALLAGLGIVLALALLIGHKTDAPREANKIVPRLDEATADRLIRRMGEDASPKALLTSCPADVWRSRGDLSRSPPVTPAACAKAPDTCLADCLEFSRGNACFTLARVMERTRDGLAAQTLHVLACAAGQSGGCVNRGGGLRNNRFADDPFPRDPAIRQPCEVRSFTIACDDDGAWGCAMRGQAYANGEGVPADAAAARRDFAKACALDPKFPACAFAKRRLAEMEAAADPTRGGPR